MMVVGKCTFWAFIVTLMVRSSTAAEVKLCASWNVFEPVVGSATRFQLKTTSAAVIGVPSE